MEARIHDIAYERTGNTARSSSRRNGKGVVLFGNLTELLISADRIADVKLASTDPAARNRLLREFELIE